MESSFQTAMKDWHNQNIYRTSWSSLRCLNHLHLKWVAPSGYNKLVAVTVHFFLACSFICLGSDVNVVESRYRSGIITSKPDLFTKCCIKKTFLQLMTVQKIEPETVRDSALYNFGCLISILARLKPRGHC